MSDRVFLERSEPVPLPSGWTRVDALTSREHRLNLIIALKQQNLDQLKETFYAVSTPGNPRYGKHLTIDQLNAMIAPTPQVANKIIYWLKSQGVRDARLLHSHDFITCSVNVAQAERIFGVKFYTYQHSNGDVFHGTLGPYSVPAAIGEHLDLISGLVGLPNYEFKKEPITNPAPAPTDKQITPTIIRARYNVSDDLVVTNSNNSNAVAEFQSQYYSPADLAQFFKEFVPFAPAQTVTKVVGTNVPTLPGTEASLDIEYIMGVAPNASTWFYSYASFNFWNDLLNWTSTLSSTVGIPWLHSVSYGTQGDYPPDATINRLDTEFQKIGARGVSILIASGDDGSGCKGGLDQACSCQLYPSYPGSSPYVTAIGATKFLNGNSGPEGAVTAFGSGGGFFSAGGDSVQAYQATAVTSYLTQSGLTLPPSCSYNATGRATPDAAALGDVHFQVVKGGRVLNIGGTSASTPTFSAIVTLLNDIRLNNGNSTLGFLNPWLYNLYANNNNAFFDVTVGGNTVNRCCGDAGGFLCTPGWDPVTGVGTPNFQVLQNNV